MSIDALDKNIGTYLRGVRPGAVAGSASRPEKDFEDILDNLAKVPKSDHKSLQSLASMAHLSQVEMLRSLFDDEGDSDDGLVTSVDTVSQWSLLQAQKSQYADSYYAVQKPSLTAEPPSDRQNIDKLIDQIAAKVCLAPELIRSVVATESNYQTKAVSPVGAQGLMQLMPATANELGVSDSFDPQENLLGGSRYLKQLLDKYDGDLDHALAAYNWGQGNVDRHGLGKMPTETRHYLAKVKELLANNSG